MYLTALEDPSRYTLIKTLDDSLVDMKAYETRWKKLADLAPAGIHAEVSSVAAAAATIVTNVEHSKTIDRAGNLASMTSVTTATSTIPEWVAKYCTK